ncbi:YcfL family protein [Shewanella submarina]|uniref:YcfL family protein n=1 Tax=Shewanella submarina TaxID=2016376 RepID=A0ABV7GD96_9GAMM|nr:YcfL family protein [Shewanella submarina]MCL1039705.1 YcfL family protein [Shewanella submarina]
MTRSLLIVSLVVLLLGGCAHNTAGVTIDSRGQVTVDGSALENKLTLSDARGKVIGRFLRASALITNDKTSNLNVQYKFTWYDAEGFVVEDDASAWIPLQLYGEARQQVQGVAPNETVTGFALTVRPVYSE